MYNYILFIFLAFFVLSFFERDSEGGREEEVWRVVVLRAALVSPLLAASVLMQFASPLPFLIICLFFLLLFLLLHLLLYAPSRLNQYLEKN